MTIFCRTSPPSKSSWRSRPRPWVERKALNLLKSGIYRSRKKARKKLLLARSTWEPLKKKLLGIGTMSWSNSSSSKPTLKACQSSRFTTSSLQMRRVLSFNRPTTSNLGSKFKVKRELLGSQSADRIRQTLKKISNNNKRSKRRKVPKRYSLRNQ